MKPLITATEVNDKSRLVCVDHLFHKLETPEKFSEKLCGLREGPEQHPATALQSVPVHNFTYYVY